MSITTELEKIFFPKHFSCINCGAEILFINDYCLCENCKIRIIREPFCIHCGKQLYTEDNVCEMCKMHNESFYECVRSCVVYEGIIINLVRSIKFGGKRYLFEPLGLMLDDYFQSLGWTDIDLIVPVPLSKRRRKKRGYNQAEELSKIIAKRNNIAIEPSMLIKTRDIVFQAKLGYLERMENIKGSYSLRIDSDVMRGKNVLLVDDVMTTGATMEECSRILKKAKPKTIRGLTFASTRAAKIKIV